MNGKELPAEYIIAHGPDGLRAVLDAMLEKIQHDEEFAEEPHYVLYQFGDQKSLIKVDMSEQPFMFWYCDLLGRPTTGIVKETIARFLWEKGGVKERYCREMEGR